MIKLEWIESKEKGWLAFDGEKEFYLPFGVVVSDSGVVEDFKNRKVYKADMVIGFWRGVFDFYEEEEKHIINTNYSCKAKGNIFSSFFGACLVINEHSIDIHTTSAILQSAQSEIHRPS